MGRGLFQLARFETACGCEVEIQVIQATLIRGYPGNSAQTAVAVRIGPDDADATVLTLTGKRRDKLRRLLRSRAYQ